MGRAVKPWNGPGARALKLAVSTFRLRRCSRTTEIKNQIFLLTDIKNRPMYVPQSMVNAAGEGSSRTKILQPAPHKLGPCGSFAPF